MVLSLLYDGKKRDGKNITIADLQTSIFECLLFGRANPRPLCLIWLVLLHRHDKEVNSPCDASFTATSVAEVSSIAQPTEPTLGIESIPSSLGVRRTSRTHRSQHSVSARPLLVASALRRTHFTTLPPHNRFCIKTIHCLRLSHLCSSMVMIIDRLWPRFDFSANSLLLPITMLL
jgi:hypothetical protein